MQLGSLRKTRARSIGRGPTGSRSGTTVIEVLVVMTILAVSVSIFSGMVVTTARQRAINRETAVAAEAARVLIETMRNTPFREIYPRYNDDPADDPDGAGTAPGHRFAVLGLQALDAAPDGLVGEVFFPDAEVEITLGGGISMIGGGGGPVTVMDLQLREDIANAELGTPRDLNGDSIIDDVDHAGDYILLPMYVSLEWQGHIGRRELQVHAILTSFQSAE